MELSEIDRKIMNELKTDIDKETIIGIMLTIKECNLTDNEKEEVLKNLSKLSYVDENSVIKIIEKYFYRIEDDD